MSSSAEPSTLRRNDSSSDDSSLNSQNNDLNESLRSIDALRLDIEHDTTAVDQRPSRKHSAGIDHSVLAKRRCKSSTTDNAEPADPRHDTAEVGTYVVSSLISASKRSNRKRTTDNELGEYAKRLCKLTLTDDPQSDLYRHAVEEKTYNASGLKRSLHGTVYQLKHLMLIVHRARKMNYSFRLATEMDIAEKFDDVVLRYIDDNRDKIFRFVQVKHKQDETKVINASDLLNVKDGDFSLLKYFISWRKIKKHPDFRGSKLKDFIVCTNIGLKVDDLKKKDIHVIEQTETDNFLDVTSRKKQPRRYKLSVKNPSGLWKILKPASGQVTNSEISCFFDEFILAVNQPNEIDLSEIIERDIGPEFNQLDAGIVRDSFQIEILNWFKTRRGDFLTREDADEFFDKMKGKLSSIKTMAVGLDHTEKLEELGIRFDNENTELQNFIHFPHVGSKQLLEIISSKQTLLTALRVFQTLTKTRECEKNENFAIVRLESLSKQKIIELVLRAFKWSADLNLLVVDCESISAKKHLQSLWNPLHDIIVKDVNKRMIAITQAGKDLGTECNLSRQICRVKNTDHSFANLTNESRKKLLGKQVSKFQGQNNKTSFGELLGIQDCDNLRKDELQDLAEILDSDVLVDFISNDGIQIGCDMEGLDESVHCYIHRTIFRHVVIKKAILEDGQIPDLFAIGGINRAPQGELQQMEEVSSITRNFMSDLFIDCGIDGHVPNTSVQIGETSPMKHSTSNFTILDRGREEEQFSALCAENRDRNVHWLQWKQGIWEEHEYVWMKSQGNINHLVRYRDATGNDDNDKSGITNLSEFNLTSHSELIIISDMAGMGKSTMLTYLASKIKKNEPNILVLKIDLNHHATALETVEQDSSYNLSSIDGAVQFVVKEFLSDETNLARKVCKRIMKRKQKVALLFDGFDEISPDYENTVLNLLKTFANYGIKKLVVATRPHTRGLLESALNAFSYEIKPFSMHDQERFLTDFWKTKFENSYDDSEQRTENRIKHYATAIVKKLADSIHDQENKFTGIPLQAKLVAEIFENRRVGAQECFQSCKEFIDSEVDDPKFPKKIDLIYLYKHFVEKKFEAFFKKTGGNFAAVATKKAKRQCFERFVDKHKQLALDALFDKNEIRELLIFQRNSSHGSLDTTDADIVEQDGIITRFIDGQPQFGHRTYAEYFAAIFFSEILKTRVQTESLRKIFVDDIFLGRNYETMRAFMNGLFSEEHVDVLRGEFWPRWLKTCRSQLNETIFHVAAVEGCGRIIELFLNCLGENTEDRKFLIHVEDSSGWTAVHWAVEYGDLDKIKLLTEETDFNINSQDVIGNTPLHRAAYTYKQDVVEYLLQKGADINSKNKDAMTPLHLAAFGGARDIVKYIVDEGADINSQTKYGSTPLHFAALKGELDIVEYLVGKGADINRQNVDGSTPLHAAAAKGALNVVDYLVGRGADINSREEDGSMPLHTAAQEGKLNVVEYLVGKGANPNSQNENSWPPLYAAAQEGNMSIVEYLVSKKADINSRLEDGSTPLHAAAQNGKLNVVKYLVGKGADINSKNKIGSTPLRLAALKGKLDVIKYLASMRADINSRQMDASTSLHAAALEGELDVVKYLVDNGADINNRSDNDSTPLHFASLKGKLDVVKYLVDKGADINSQNQIGWQPLYAAAQEDKWDVVEYLVGKGAGINSQNKNGWTPLHHAAIEGKLGVVEYLVGKGADINIRQEDGSTPLHFAALNGKLNVVEYFIGKGADINSQGEDDSTPLHLAVTQEKLDVVEYLVSKRADINSRNMNGTTPLHIAAVKEKLDVVKFLVGKGADINSQDKFGVSPLVCAVLKGNLDIVEYLTGKGADVNSQDEDGSTPLHAAVQDGKLNVVEYFVSNGADINSRDKLGSTPLVYAVLKGYLDIVDYLTGKGADINSQDEDGSTPLHVAVRDGKLNIVEYLVGNGADINSQNMNGCTPLHFAAVERKLDVVEYLIGKGADINSQENNGSTPLIYAALKGKLDVVEYLVDRAADINLQNENGSTALHAAAQEGKLNVVEYLVGKGADINFQAMNGSTPLHFAVGQEKLDVVKYLVSQRADINSQDKNGLTPLIYAVLKGKLDVVEYLVDSAADINTQNEYGSTPLHAAAQEGKLHVVEYLVDKGADINFQDMNGSTPLHFAALKGKIDVVEYLVGKGADINSRQEDGSTPLHRAALQEKLDVVEYFIDKGADINSQDKNGSTPLTYAALKGKLNVVDYLVGRAADIKPQNENGSTPLHAAAHEEKLNVVEYLVGKGADINFQDKNGSTSLYFAALKGNLDVVEYLVGKGADINAQDKNGSTPLVTRL